MVEEKERDSKKKEKAGKGSEQHDKGWIYVIRVNDKPT